MPPADIVEVHLTTNLGLEDLVEAELRRRAGDQGLDLQAVVQRPEDRPGHVRARVAGGEPALTTLTAALRSVHHVLRPLDRFRLGEGEPLDLIQRRVAALDAPELDAAASFRVTCVRRGAHPFGSPDVERRAGAGVRERRALPVDLTGFELELRVDVTDDLVEVSVQRTRRALSVRSFRPYRPRTALRANVGWAMCALTLGLDAAPARVADPCCGSGTLLLEAGALWPAVQLRAGDRHPRCVAGVSANLAALGLADRAEVRQEDARAIGTTWRDLPPVDAILSNPPWGVRLGRKVSQADFLRRLLLAAAGVLPRGGRLGLLVLKRGAFNRALAEVGGLRTVHTRVVEVGGLHPGLFVLERT